MSVKCIGSLSVDKPYRALRNMLAPSYVSSRRFRPIYTSLMHLRSVLLSPVYSRLKQLGYADIAYSVERGVIHVHARWSLSGGRIMIASELRGRLFDELRVDGGQSSYRPRWSCDVVRISLCAEGSG